MRNISHPIRTLAIAGDKALDKWSAIHLPNRYGTSTPGTFGWAANISSARSAYSLIKRDINDVEKISSAIHKGWGMTAKTFEDPKYLTKPEKRISRLEQANTEYRDLPEEEKEKDRILAKAYMKTLGVRYLEIPAKY